LPVISNGKERFPTEKQAQEKRPDHGPSSPQQSFKSAAKQALKNSWHLTT
jgi:hypothetical protein